LLTQKLLKIRYYVTVIFDVIKFLASNKFSFRSNDELYSVFSSETCSTFGLFLRLSKFTLYTPNAAICNSPVIQNEPLEIMAKTVCEKTADKYR
ncbi:hypothetical protein T12_12808, partial [Trichinella patagoniensis]